MSGRVGAPKRKKQATCAVRPEVEEMNVPGLWWYVANGHVVSPAEEFLGFSSLQLATQRAAGFSGIAYT